MRKFILTVMASLLSCSVAQAFWPEASESLLEIGVGYRQDSLEWRTGHHHHHHSSGSSDYSGSYGYDTYGTYGDDTCVGFPLRARSKFKWHDLQIWQIEGRAKYVTCDNIYLRAYGDYGWVTSGKHHIHEHLDFSTGEVSFSEYDGYSSSSSGSGSGHHRSHTKGNVYDIKLAVGYQFKWCDDSLALAPLVGYSWHGQHFRDHLRRNSGAFQAENGGNNNFLGARSSYYYDYSSASFDTYNSSSSHGGEHSRYHTRWNGPFIGFDFDYRFGCGCDWAFFGGYEFHWAYFHAKAHGQALRPGLCHGFHQRAKNAYGQYVDLGVKWDFCDCWTAAIIGQFQWWYAHHGRDRARIAEGEFCNVRTDCHLTTHVKDIKWWSGSISLNIGMLF